MQSVFTAIVINHETICGELPKNIYASRRVSLLRKFAAYRAQLQAMGMDTLDDCYIKASWNPETGVATFQLAEKQGFFAAPAAKASDL